MMIFLMMMIEGSKEASDQDLFSKASFCRNFVRWRQCSTQKMLTKKRVSNPVIPREHFFWRDKIGKELFVSVKSLVSYWIGVGGGEDCLVIK